MDQILSYIYIIAAVLFLFGAAVFVHEFGHFWVARRRGLVVEEFAIGFGPKIWSKVYKGVEYSIRAIPAGGFVKLPQMVTSEAIEGKGDQKAPPPPVSPFSKILVAIAGPFMNVVFAFVIATAIYFLGLPVPVNPPIVGYVTPDSKEAKLGIKEGDRILSVDGKAVKSWQEVQENTIFARTNDVEVVVQRGTEKQTYTLTATINEQLQLKMLNLDPKEHPVITQINPNSPAEKAGFKLEDEFISFASMPIASQEQLIQLIRDRSGQASEVVVKRQGEQLTLTVTPEQNPETKQGRIGVGMIPSSKVVYEVQKPGPTPLKQVVDVWNRTINTLGALFHSKQTGVGIKDLSGPPGILAMLGAQVKADYRLALSFLVLLNINLAILNLLPVPVLDGGHIVMALIEKIFRRPLSPKFVEWTTTAFAVMLLSFMAFVSFNDVTKRFGLFKSMYQREVQIDKAPAPSNEPAAPHPAK